MTTADDVDRIGLRRAATETLIRSGHHEDLGPAAWYAALEPKRFVRRPHTNVIDTAITKLLVTPGDSLMIWTPPRAGKSMLVSQILPAWWLTYRPADAVVLSAYAERLAMRHAVGARGITAAYGPQYGLRISAEQAAKSDWRLAAGGGMIARGVGSGLTGENMHLGIIDDPVKDRAAAESDTIRSGVWDWYSGSFLSRLEPHTRRVVIMTRWRTDDLAGRILDSEGRVEEGGRWRVLHLPALALPENRERGIYADPLGRAPGGPLTHPKIDVVDTAAALAHWEQQRALSSTRDWNALYQGTPYDVEGSLLTDDDVRAATGRSPGQFRRIAVGVDPAGGGRDTVGVVAVGLDADRRAWFLADRTARMPAAEWPRIVCQVASHVGADRIVVEKNYGGDMGKQLLVQAWEALSRAGDVDGLCPLVVDAVALKSKVLRAEPVAQAVKTGRVWFDRDADLRQLAVEFTMWEPGSKWSPGALDAAVHAVTDLLPTSPRGSEVHNPARRPRSIAGEGRSGLAGRRR